MIFYIVYVQPLKLIVAITIFMLIVWTIAGICFQKHTKSWRVMNGILTALSLAAILYSTIIHRTVDTTQSIPFIRTIEHIRQQPELIREMVMNVFLFFPLGLTMPYAIGNKVQRPVLITIISAFLLTCTIELIQYLSNFGNCELSDIVMNTLGAAIGSVSYLVSSRLRR